MVVCHLPVSCLRSRAAAFPHEKPERLITCSATHITHSSCSHVLSPCSPQPDARSCIPAGDAARSPQGKSSGAARPLLHTPEQGCWPVPGQGTQARATCSSYLHRNGRNSSALVTLEEAAMFDLLVLAAGCFPYSLCSEIIWTAGVLRKGLFSSRLITQLSPWSLMLLL